MKHVVKQLVNDLKIKKYDWMGFKISKNNKLTYHHIFKAVYGEYGDVDTNYIYKNGMPLTKRGHALLHKIENDNIEMYIAINKIFIVAKHEGIEKYQWIINILIRTYLKGKNDNLKRTR